MTQFFTKGDAMSFRFGKDTRTKDIVAVVPTRRRNGVVEVMFIVERWDRPGYLPTVILGKRMLLGRTWDDAVPTVFEQQYGLKHVRHVLLSEWPGDSELGFPVVRAYLGLDWVKNDCVEDWRVIWTLAKAADVMRRGAIRESLSRRIVKSLVRCAGRGRLPL